VIFTTPQFVVFFCLFFLIWTLSRGRGRSWILLIASYAFYASWNAKFLVLIIGSTLVDFYVGRRLGVTHDARRRKRLLALSVGVNLGALAFFKYCNFFVESAVAALGALGLEASLPSLEIVLPVGISFYTFQTMSYTIDIYRRKLDPTDRLLDFALFVAFFPQLVAGPIERARNLLPQIANLAARRPDYSGFGLIALGCFKKVVIADNLAALVELVYADPSHSYGPALWLGTYAFAVQIYCDFSGYSDIAVGLARLMGLDLIQNFEAPYAARGPSEFWRRWHISLSSWLRDYLYISLGGNRGTRLFVYRNLMLTMLLGGLWHGAAGNFVLWGAWHGLLLILFRLRLFAQWGERLDAKPMTRVASTAVRRLVFFHLVCLGWAFFRAGSLADCLIVVERLVCFWAWDIDLFVAGVVASGLGGWLLVCGVTIVLTVGAQMAWPVGSNVVVARLWRKPEWVRFLVVATLLYACMLGAPEVPPPFIYFQF
jgi:alginate O-acetyltransferase complex protein AlgI